jgi:xanthine/CO dehydrogenase XdhC/CoxF family maturation factor
MKEIHEILTKVSELGPNEKAILATVIDLHGSGYRLPGARMLIVENGDTFGTVSGGCLEADVLERAKKILKSGKAEVFTYDTNDDENSVFSLNMGCRGVIRILLEPIGRESEITRLLSSNVENRKKCTVATYIGGNASEKLEIGARIFVGQSGKLLGNVKTIIEAMPGIDDDFLTFHESSSAYETMRYANEAGEAEFAFETLQPPVLIAIFGAGADAVPLAKAASDLGWRVNVFDHRPAFLAPERFPYADDITLVERETTNFNLATDDRTAIVSMNHNYDRDKEAIRFALRTDAFYIGALGPKKRTEQILGELSQHGDAVAADALSRLRFPAGLDIGGDTPESIAISIIAEIQSVLKKRPGSSLRNRDGSIYDRK